MVSLALIFVSCAGDKGGNGPSNSPDAMETQCKSGEDYTTITVKANLESGYSVKVEGTAGTSYDVSLSTGQCVKIGCATGVVVSIEQNNTFNQLCSNKDEDKENDCTGNYNVVYTVADAQKGTNKLALESVDLNKGQGCIALLPEDKVYTITLVADLGNRTVKVQNEEKAKTLKGKDSCLKLRESDFFNLQIDVGEGDENRRVLCNNKAKEEVNQCNEYDKINFEIDIYGQPPNHDAVVLNAEKEYNSSEKCEWLSE